jgi:hypothetical protein
MVALLYMTRETCSVIRNIQMRPMQLARDVRDGVLRNFRKESTKERIGTKG